jgi:hypothetical protein
MTGLTDAAASQFARIALGHVEREYPNKLDHVLTGPQDARGPRALHPVFYGSFDWHSCVHAYWMLARLRRRFPSLPEAEAISALFDRKLTAPNIAVEVAYALRYPGFERPYGWAWLLMLAAELGRDTTAEGRGWRACITPLAEAFADRFRTFLPKADYPIRVGTHTNSAFALALALDYARSCGDTALDEIIRRKARLWYESDANCQAWEPGGDEFLSPVLIEAECMRRVLPAADFVAWFGRFLPRLGAGKPVTLFSPAAVSDRSDGKIAHLDGLNLSRAWCWRLLAAALPTDDPRRGRALAAANEHLAASLPAVAGEYMGEHWLASFAVLAIEAEASHGGSSP